MFPQDEVLVAVRDGVGLITLNRPEVLNALSLGMVRTISETLARWQTDDSVRVIVFCGAGPRAFCAGGDIKASYYEGLEYRQGRADISLPLGFFKAEYAMNQQIFHYPKPLVAFMDGITMGGGYGIAGHCRYKIATDQTTFAMPEVGIGLFPDVGSVHHLWQVHYFFGHYLALTGHCISGPDMLGAGLADYYISAIRLPELLEALRAAQDDAQIHMALAGLAMSYEREGVYFWQRDAIESAFSSRSLAGVLSALEKDDSVFALATLETLSHRAPLSVAVTHEYLHRAPMLSFDAVIAQDLILTRRFISAPDFYEGVRAALIDKDKQPRWNPASFEEIAGEPLHSYFNDFL